MTDRPASLPPAEPYDRPVIGEAHYPDDCRATFDETRPYGPGYDGEYRWVVATGYDPDLQVTTVYFSKVPPPVDLAALTKAAGR